MKGISSNGRNSKELVPANEQRVGAQEANVAYETEAKYETDVRIAKWIMRGLFFLAGLSWLTALVGSINSPVQFAGTLTAGVTSMFAMLVGQIDTEGR